MPSLPPLAAPESRKLPSWLRWFDLCVRSVHLAAVVLLGASVLGAPLGGALPASIVVASGLFMLSLDTWQRRSHLGELAGATMLFKLVLVAWMAAVPDVRLWLFWLVVGISGVVSHAPSRFRHASLPGRSRPGRSPPGRSPPGPR